MHCNRREFWKNILVSDIEELEVLDASEIHARRLNAKESMTPNSGEHFIFPIADGAVELSGDQVFRKSTLMRDQPVRGEVRKDDLQGSSDKSQPTDETKNDAEARNDFRSKGIRFVVIMSNFEFASSCRRNIPNATAVH